MREAKAANAILQAFYSAVRGECRPPSFVAWCSRPDALPASYQRYLVNGLRHDFGLEGVPIRLALRKGENPYVKKG